MRTHLGWMALFCWCCLAANAAAQPASPWGISSSASSMRNHAEWFPKMSAAGVTTVRLFPEWQGIERKQGEFQWDAVDKFVAAAAANKLEINAPLMGSAAWTKDKIHAFPMQRLPEWSKWVEASAARYKGKIKYWEVWNEGNGGFNDDKHTTADYAQLAIATYEAIKRGDPDAQVGLTVASYDAPYLIEAIRAMKVAGKPNSFDYLCLHPYEIADGLADPYGELPFLWMSKLLRDSLKIHAPEKANCEIWLTEVGRRIGTHGGRTISEEQAAADLVKLYVMSLAQGISCTQWFEAQDPAGEDQGFGLIGREGKERTAYAALKNLTQALGAKPNCLGWKQQDIGCYGFVFQMGTQESAVMWLAKGEPSQEIAVIEPIEMLNLISGNRTSLKVGEKLTLSEQPVLVTLTSGRLNPSREQFPWGFSFAGETKAELQLGGIDPEKKRTLPRAGIFQVGRDSTPTVTFPDGTTGILLRGDQSASFYVHPSFKNLEQREYYVRVTTRRIAPGNVGFNINYEVADSQGKTPYKNRGIWYGMTASNDWQTHTWHLTDACFAKMWGYDFSFRPEQSVPFVIGKVEISTEPFK